MFSQEQLDLIHDIARHSKNQGELAVWIGFGDIKYTGKFTSEQYKVVLYCAQECKRQRSGEMSVYDMVNAWEYAIKTAAGDHPLHLEYIKDIGFLVEPDDNKKGLRTQNIRIRVDNFTTIEKGAKWDRVPILLEMLLDSYYTGLLATDAIDASNGDPHYAGWNSLSQSAEDQFYYEYENIHPFVDGNGRSGKILYNYLKGTLDNPVMPPNFWDSEAP